MKPLNIGVFGARGIPSTYSGYETFLTSLLPELVQRGHNVTMYCRTGEVDGSGPYLGVDRVVLPALPGKQFNTLSHGLLASARARVARHDVVLAVNVANALFCALQRYTGVPVVLNTDGQEWLRGKWGNAAKAYFKTSAKWAGRCATALVSDCEAMQNVYRDEFNATSTVIPYSVPSKPVAPSPEVLARLGIERNGYFIVAARLNPENNVDAIAQRYTQTSFDMPLVVLGAANYQSPVEQNLANAAARDSRIHVVGHVDNRDEFFELLGSARAYLHGHSVGGINPSLVEAMHAGARIAALDTPFNRETLGEQCTLFTLDSLSDVLADVLAESPQVQDSVREYASNRAATRFNVDAVVSAYEELLSVTAASSSRTPLALRTQWNADS